MYPPTEPVELPKSYAKLDLPHVKVSHVPESSSEVTQILVLTLNRPEKGNAFTGPMQQSITAFYNLVNQDDRVKVVVLTGAGKSFCNGADLELGFLGGASKSGKGAAKSERDIDHRDGGGRASLALHQCSKPTVAAINGHAVGVGITLPLAATIRVAYENAKIGFVFSRRGIIMEACSHYFLPRLIGMAKALHLTTTGAVYPANHHLTKDLFSETLATPEATVKRALEIADEIAKNTSTVSTKLMRDLMYRGGQSAEEAHLLDSRVIHSLFGSKDNMEGVTSFFEKRPPRFAATMQNDAPESWPWWAQTDIGYRPRGNTSKASKL